MSILPVCEGIQKATDVCQNYSLESGGCPLSMGQPHCLIRGLECAVCQLLREKLPVSANEINMLSLILYQQCCTSMGLLNTSNNKLTEILEKIVAFSLFDYASKSGCVDCRVNTKPELLSTIKDPYSIVFSIQN